MPASATGRTPAPAHILAIDNDQAVLGLCRDLLADEGDRVTTQASRDQALAESERIRPDLIIRDDKWIEEDNG